MPKPQSVFNEIYNSISSEVEYKETWANGTGYLDGAVKEDIYPQELYKSVDPNGRRIILLGTRFGTVVVFERFKPLKQEKGEYEYQGIIVGNSPKILKGFLPSSSWDGDDVYRVLLKGDTLADNIEGLFQV